LDLNSLKAIVLDEADQVLDDMGDTIKRIKTVCPKNVLTLLFSATFPDKIRSFALKSFINKPYKHILLKVQDLTVEEISQYKIDCTGQGQNRFEVLNLIYNALTITKSIIFVRTKVDAKRIYDEFSSKGWKNLFLLHGGLQAEDRDANMTKFRDAKNGILISTNLLARGIDVLGITVVINYDLPTFQDSKPDPVTYIHRIGRTGRFGFRGIAINLLHSAQDKNVMKEIEGTLGDKAKITSLKYDNALPEKLIGEQEKIDDENKKRQQELQKK